MAALYTTSVKGLSGDYESLGKAQELQDRVARADFIIVKAGIPGTKYALDTFVEKGLGGECRLPLNSASELVRKMVETELKQDWDFEKSL